MVSATCNVEEEMVGRIRNKSTRSQSMHECLKMEVVEEVKHIKEVEEEKREKIVSNRFCIQASRRSNPLQGAGSMSSWTSYSNTNASLPFQTTGPPESGYDQMGFDPKLQHHAFTNQQS